MAQYSPYLQRELASDSQPVESLGDPVHVLRDPLRGGLQSYKMAIGRDKNTELYITW